MDVDTVIKCIESFSLADLEKCKDRICQLIHTIKNNVTLTPSMFVDFHDNFVQPGSSLYKDINIELQTFQL